MSAEEAHLMEQEEGNDDSGYDVVLILKNIEIYPMEDVITANKLRKRFQRIFKLDEKTEKGEIIQKIEYSFESFMKNHTTESILVKDSYLVIVENIKTIIDEYLELETKAKFSVDQDEIHICIRASENGLMIQADLDDFLLQLKKEPDENLDFQTVSPFGPFEREAKLVKDNMKSHDFFKRYDQDDNEGQNGSLFKQKDRIKLIYSMLCNGLDIGLLTKLGIILNYMPLSNKKKLTHLKEVWGSFGVICRHPLKRANIHEINDYYGEKIGMYFAWLEFLMINILPLSIISLGLGFIYLFCTEEDDSSYRLTPKEIVAIILALLLPFFSTSYEQLWIRQQNTICWEWGTTDLSQVEEQRPEYDGKYQKDPITGNMKKIPKETEWVRTRRIFGSSVVGMFVALVLVTVVALFIYRASLDKDSYGPTLVGIGNAVQIKIFNFIYGYVAVALNNWENYELPSQYSDNLTVKLFLFQFVNSYTSLFYIAFFKGDHEGCSDDNCIDELSLQLETIFITNFLLNLVEIFTPMLLTKYKTWSEKRAIEKKYHEERVVSEEEWESKLSKYDTPLSDYMEVVILYGYVILFGSSFAFTPFLFLVLVAVEIRVDAWKLCNLTQRPYPEATNSIGAWLSIIQIMSIVGAITNVGIIVFTTNAFDLDEDNDKWILFIILEHCLLFFKIVISTLIPDVPEVVGNGLVWSKRIIDEKLYGKISDADKALKSKNQELSGGSKPSKVKNS